MLSTTKEHDQDLGVTSTSGLEIKNSEALTRLARVVAWQDKGYFIIEYPHQRGSENLVAEAISVLQKAVASVNLRMINVPAVPSDDGTRPCNLAVLHADLLLKSSELRGNPGVLLISGFLGSTVTDPKLSDDAIVIAQTFLTLNMARENFLEIPCIKIFLMTPDEVTAFARGAPDFYSIARTTFRPFDSEQAEWLRLRANK